MNMNKTPNWGDWEQLIPPYFSDTCRRVLGNYLNENHFIEIREEEGGGLTFSRLNTFIEIKYILETVPQYLTIILGIEGEGRIDCLHSIPDNQLKFWTNVSQFKNEAELEKALIQFRDGIFEAYTKPLWSNVDQLKDVIEAFRAQALEESERDMLESRLSQARQVAEIAWKNKDYALVVKHLKPLCDSLLPFEVAKLKFAEKHL
jgi:hypothetical protein